MKPKPTAALKLAKLCCRALEEKKAEDVRVLDVSAKSSITDYLVLATGTSAPHLRALRMELEKELDADGVHLVGLETTQESGWTVVDAFDVMIHLFSPEMRAHYSLENLWKDGVEVSVVGLLAAPKKRQPTAKPRKSVRRPRAS
jgi:ribosome-associated protein